MKQITRDEAVRIGTVLRNCAKGEEFDHVVDVLKAQYTTQFVQSEPDAIAKREDAYRQLRALEDFVGTINTFIAIAEADALEVEPDEDTIFP